MNILFYLTRYPGIGGIENVTNIIASRLQMDNEISIISHIQSLDVLPLVSVRLFQMPNSNEWCAKENLEYAMGVMESQHFDVIIYQDSYAPTETIVCQMVKEYNVPLYVFEHNSPLFVYNKRTLDPITTSKGILRRLLHPFILHREVNRKRYLLSHAKKYILLSKQFIPEFCKLIDVDVNDERITYINNPALPIELDTCIKKENVILCVSRLAREKCVDKILTMWWSLSCQLTEWRLVIVGDGPERLKLEAMVSKNNIPRVEFIGFASPIPYYQKAKMFWMTSKFEGWGMTLIESMQQGCVPVVFQTFSSAKDIISSGYNGFLIEPNNWSEYQNRTLELANDEHMRTCMAERGIEAVRDFSIDKILYQWEKLLK